MSEVKYFTQNDYKYLFFGFEREKNTLTTTMNSMLWTLPPKYKIFEALGALADGRIEIVNPES
jgi:hypothetical protein